MRFALLVVVAACSAPAGRPAEPVAPPMLGPLPAARPVATDSYPGVVACVRCHTAGEHGQMRDTDGSDMSPVTDANGAMMSLAARDPYYLAAFRRELLADPAGAPAINDLCTRCHAPVGYSEAKLDGAALTLDALVSGDGSAAALGREGVGCMGCHAMLPDGLGDNDKLVGRAPLRADRVAYGVIAEPLEAAMVAMIKSKPVPSPHMLKSELCASCHTLFVRPLDAAGHESGGEVAEQATFLEWRASSFANPDLGKTCQDCHMALHDPGTQITTRPPDAPGRGNYRRHTIRGGNAYLLASLADAATSWLRAAATSTQLTQAAADTQALLATAARLELSPTAGGVTITVRNLTGHKLPTGFPTRRMWLHVVARDVAGHALLESGRHVRGAILGDADARLDAPGRILPHVDRIESANDVAIWEAVPVDAAGRRTHLLMGTARLAKDDRILPAGYHADGTDLARTKPIGTDGDSSFVPGSDAVTVALPAGTTRVEVQLLYQPIPPETMESYAAKDSLEAARFLQVASQPPEPQVLATVSWTR